VPDLASPPAAVHTVSMKARLTAAGLTHRAGEILDGAGGGHGLTAMRERTARAGGTARAGPTPDGWRVELEVPA
jgi:hypothetical protein